MAKRVYLISAVALRAQMDRRNLSCRQLATRTADQGEPVAHSIIGHLMTGYTIATSLEKARAIEKALRVQRGTLFDLSEVPTGTRVMMKEVS